MSLGFMSSPSIDTTHERDRILRIPMVAELTEAEQADVLEMSAQLNRSAGRNRERFVFYNSEQQFVNMGVAIPREFEQFASVLGWNRTAVDTLARRIQLDGFVAAGSTDRFSGLDAAFQRMRFYSQVKAAIQSMLIYGVAFVGVTRNNGQARVQGFSARDATGLWDDARPGRLRCGLAVTEWFHAGPRAIVLFYPGQQIELRRETAYSDWTITRFSVGPSDRVTLHPFRFLPQLDKPWGQSRISRPMISLTRSGARSFLRAEMNGEIYGYPQLYGLNMRPEDAEKFRSGVAKFFAIDYERDEDGAPVEKAPEAKIGQVQIGSQQPHLDALRMTAMMYAAESQLSPDKMGVIHDNASSADAIDRADGELNDLAEETGQDLDVEIVDLMQSVWLIENRQVALPPEIAALSGDWHDPGMTTRYSQRMAMSSLATAGLVQGGETVTYEAAGFSKSTSLRMVEAWREAERRKSQQAIAEQAIAARGSSTAASLISQREAGPES